MEARPALSRTQSAVLDAIRTSVRERGYPPTLREVGATVGLASSSSVAQVVQTLEARGYLHREPGSARSLTILDDPDPVVPTADEALWFLKGSSHPRATSSGADRYTCPGCGRDGLQQMGITALAYVFDTCTCRDLSFKVQHDHLVEQLWHRSCLTRSSCDDQG